MKVKQLIVDALNNRRLTLILMSTEKCNFRCTYCYEDLKIGKMRKEVVKGICNLIAMRIKKNSLESLEISWFGGEPLLALDVINEINRNAIKLCKTKEIPFTSGITTNAYRLNEQVFEQLVNKNVNFFHISLDGDQDMHDTTRRRADGKGTFKQIWDNLSMMQNTSYNFGVLLRLHVTEDNHKSMLALSKKINCQFADDKRFRINFRGLANYRGDNQEIYPDISKVEQLT